MKKKNSTLINKIEIDEKTNEPKIVLASQKEIEKKFIDKKPKKQKKEKKPLDEGQQLVMKNLFGIEDDSKIIDKKQRFFKKLFTVIFIVFVVGVLAWTAYNDFFSGKKEFPSLTDINNILSSSWFYIIFAFVSLFLVFFFKGLKLSVICKYLSGKWHFKTCMETGIVGQYYNNVTPLAVGGQPFEIYHLSKHGVHGGVASSLPIITFFLNQLAFVALGITALVLYSTNALGIPFGMMNAMPTIVSISAIVGLFCCIIVPFLVVLFSMLPKIGGKLVTFVIKIGNKLHIVKDPEKLTQETIKTVIHNAKCVKKVSTNPAMFLLSFIISIAEHLSLCSIAYFTLRFFGFDWPAPGFLEWAEVVQLCMILYSAISFIPTPGNSGAADISFYLLFETGLMINNSNTTAVAFLAMLVWRLLCFYSFVIIGFIFTKRKKKSDEKLLNPQE